MATTILTLAPSAAGDPPLCVEIVSPQNGTAAQTGPNRNCSELMASVTSVSSTSQSTPAPGFSSSSVSSTTNPPLASQISTSTDASGTSSTGVPETSQPPTGAKGLAGGAVAGVAIGMLFAGVILASVIFLFLLRRQKRGNTRSSAAQPRQHGSYPPRHVGPEKGAVVVAAPSSSIDDFLPQPMGDEAIAGDLSKIRDSIKNHVHTYYHSGATSNIDPTGIRDIAELTGMSTNMLMSGLSDSNKRHNALRSVIAAVILTRCTGERSPSLLPVELAALSASMPINNTNNTTHMFLFSKWKAITGALLQPGYGKQRQDSSRAQSFQDTMSSLNVILAPFVKSNIDVGQREKNLEMILTRAANFAFLLFTQPGSFHFDFFSHQGRLTVFPTLVQTVGDHGQPLSSPKQFNEKEEVAA